MEIILKIFKHVNNKKTHPKKSLKNPKKTKHLKKIPLYKIGLEGTARYTGILLAPQEGFFTLFLLMLGHLWCLAVTSVNLESIKKIPKIPKKSKNSKNLKYS